MKNILFRSLASLFAATMIFVACTKEDKDVKLDPILSTSESVNITSNSATIIGFVVSTGSGFTEQGVCYGLSTEPTIDANKVAYTKDTITATFEVTLTGLDYATKYYARAYAITSSGTIYGEEITFTTLPVLATIATTTAITAITGNSATTGGDISNAGGAEITKRGVCFSVLPSPTVDDSVTVDDKGIGVYTSLITDLKGNKKYYVRAYATNSVGTAYGNEVSFTTLVNIPLVSTTAISNLTVDGAKSGGNVTDDGGNAISARGICWSTSANPTISDNKTSNGTGLGEFTSTITGLALSTTYHVRAYAVNSAGVAYGSDVQFSTYPPALFMIGDGVGGWDWSTVDLPMIPVNGQLNLFWKIVWLNATGEFKFAPQKAWNGDFGKTGSATAGVYSKGGDNIPVPGTAGYYMIVVDFATGKIAIADPKVYLIGNTIGSWDTAKSDALFTIDNSIVTITKTLAADELRMYAWHPWFSDWWRSEFIILGGKIEFRGNGNDQARVTPTAGNNKIDLNFKTGDGSITLLP